MIIHILGTMINTETIEKISRLDDKTAQFNFISGEKSQLVFKDPEKLEHFLDYIMRKLDSINYHDVVEFIQDKKINAKKTRSKK